MLNGEKIFITNAGHAGLYVIFADTGGKDSGKLSGFLVPADAQGFSIVGYEQKMGIRGSTAGHLLLKIAVSLKKIFWASRARDFRLL